MLSHLTKMENNGIVISNCRHRAGVIEFDASDNDSGLSFTDIELSYPTYTGNIYVSSGVQRYMPYVFHIKLPELAKAVTDSGYVLKLPDDFTKLNPSWVAIRLGLIPAIRKAFSTIARGYEDYERQAFTAMVDNSFRHFYTCSEYPRLYTDTINPMKALIVIPGVDPLDVRFRLPKIQVDPSAGIDLSSTAISGKNAGLVVDLALGNSKLSVLQKNVIFPFQTKKVVGTRSAFEQTCKLLRGEEPIAHAAVNALDGTNLLVAVMVGRYNHLDAVMMRRESAPMLDSIERFKYTVRGENIMVKNEDYVYPGQTIAISEGTATPTRYLAPIKGRVDAIVTHNGDTTIHTSCIYKFGTGDKVTTRNGYKAIARLCDDSEMPWFGVDNIGMMDKVGCNFQRHIVGERIIPDMVVDPIGLRNRCNISFLLEMAASSQGILNCQQLSCDKKLDNLLAAGEYLGRPIVGIPVGYVYFFRLNKHAIDSNYSGAEITESIKRGRIADSSLSGARWNLTNTLVAREGFSQDAIVENVVSYKEVGAVVAMLSNLRSK